MSFFQASSVEDAVKAKMNAPASAFIAGGQSLVPRLRRSGHSFSSFIDLSRIEALLGMRTEGEWLDVGAAVTHRELADSDAVRMRAPGLAALAGGLGDPQVRNRGTLGGAVAERDPRSDWAAALLAADAQLITNRRQLGVEEYFAGAGLAPDELLCRIRLRCAWTGAYAKLPAQASRQAIVGVYVSCFADNGPRVAVTGAFARPQRATALEQALARNFASEAVADDAFAGLEVVADAVAGAAYREAMLCVFARRAVAACMQQ